MQNLFCSSNGPSPLAQLFEFLHNLSFPAKFWQDPAGINILCVATIGCQYFQDPARIWQERMNYAKTRLILTEIDKETGTVMSLNS